MYGFTFSASALPSNGWSTKPAKMVLLMGQIKNERNQSRFIRAQVKVGLNLMGRGTPDNLLLSQGFFRCLGIWDLVKLERIGTGKGDFPTNYNKHNTRVAGIKKRANGKSPQPVLSPTWSRALCMWLWVLGQFKTSSYGSSLTGRRHCKPFALRNPMIFSGDYGNTHQKPRTLTLRSLEDGRMREGFIVHLVAEVRAGAR
jgi:hypothetical protein